ncbi:hypothetical protein [Sphingobacterium kitahiroshimense]|uniref:hypothetical protein n=1 Tax=Sphingobacterium kitahiroshimense TaxID=470446 RepID=UPI003207D481
MNRYILLFILVLSGLRAFPQLGYFNSPDSAAMFPKKYRSFEHYAFVLNGKVIGHEALVNYREAKLNNIFSYPIKLGGRRYLGAVYFHTEERYAPPVRDTNLPAYFINGTQVSPYQIRLIKMELYKRIAKSTQDTTINGILYRGSIHVETEEDFFADRISLPDLIEKYTGLPLEEVIVHWHHTQYRYIYEGDIGMIIENNFPLYSYTINNLSLKGVSVDRVRFAQGDRYVVHLIDNSYNWSNPKARSFFAEPLVIDTLFPCYVPDFDVPEDDISTHTEVEPRPGKDLNFYLKKLSSTMGLPTVKPSTAIQSDSITVQFIILKDGMIANLKNVEPDKHGHEDILTAIKKNACLWLPSIQGGRPLLFRRKMVIFYSKDQKGNIQSLDGLKYRYNFVQTNNKP